MREERGFTLLEVLVALAIFAFVASAAVQTMANSDYLAASARRARELRMLAERKLGEVLAFEQHYDDNYELQDFDYPEYEDHFKDWKWQLDVRDVTVFGTATEDAPSLYGETDEEKEAQQNAGASGSTAGTQPGQTQRKGEAQQVRELTLRVSAPAEGGASDSVQLIVFAPLVTRKTAGSK